MEDKFSGIGGSYHIDKHGKRVPVDESAVAEKTDQNLSEKPEKPGRTHHESEHEKTD